MVAPLQRVLVCSPRAAGWDITARADRWQELGFLHRPEFSTAQAQHDQLCRQLELAGAEVIHLPAAPDLTLDAVYTHDPSLTTDQGLIALNPGKPNRVPEAKYHVEFTGSVGIPAAGQIHPPGKTEAGDMVWLDSTTLLIGQGIAPMLQELPRCVLCLSPMVWRSSAAPLPYGPGPSACLHLMSLISLLDEHIAVVDLPWLSVETVELLRSRGYNLIEIEYSERDSLACNVLSLGNKRLLALEENQKTNRNLRGRIRRADFPGLGTVCQWRRRPYLPDPSTVTSRVGAGVLTSPRRS